MKAKILDRLFFVLLFLLAIVFIFPVFVVLINSFKFKFSITSAPFVLPNKETFSGLSNYIEGVTNTGFLTAFMWSLVITVSSVLAIIIFTSMTAWFTSSSQ